jgi:hypothetical protein
LIGGVGDLTTELDAFMKQRAISDLLQFSLRFFRDNEKTMTQFLSNIEKEEEIRIKFNKLLFDLEPKKSPSWLYGKQFDEIISELEKGMIRAQIILMRSAVVAESFARIFYRNSIDQGLPVLTCPSVRKGFKSSDAVEVDIKGGTVRNVTSGKVFKVEPFPDFILEILRAGGLVPYLKRKGALKRK